MSTGASPSQTNKNSKHFWCAWSILFLTSIAGMRLLGSKKISPFVTTPQNAFGEYNAWAYKCFSEQQVAWFVFADFLFAFLLATLVIKLYPVLTGRVKNWHYILFAVFATLACCADVVEGIAIWCNADSFSSLNFTKIILYAITWLWFVYLLINYLVKRWWAANLQELLPAFAKQYLPYFYPGIISILAFYFIVNSLDQFDALIYDLAQPINLPIFVILFAATLIKVWFLPYYVQFSNVFYDLLEQGNYNKEEPQENVVLQNESLSKVLSWRGVFAPITALLKDEVSANLESENGGTAESSEQVREETARVARAISLKVRKEEIALGKLPDPSDQQKVHNWLNSLFHAVRRYVGLIFILLFFWLQINALSEVVHQLKGLELLAVALLAALLVWALNESSKYVKLYFKEKPARLDNVYEEDLKKAIEKEENRRKIRNWAFVLLGIAVASWLLTSTLYCNKSSTAATLTSFSLSTIIAAFAFVLFVAFRYPKVNLHRDKEKKLPSDLLQKFKKISLENDKYQNILTRNLILYITIIIPLLFLSLLTLSFIDLSFFSYLNPINYYLLYINGIIAILAIANRLLLLRLARIKFIKGKESRVFRLSSGNTISQARPSSEAKKDQKDYLRRRLALTFTICILLFLLGQGNNYHHQINYLSVAQAQAPSFEQYTENFLQQVDTTADKKRIYFIAAEGGGLRAAYWTMLVLQRMDPEILDRTFMMSGASGGALGQGVMTFLDYQNVGSARRDSVIRDVGEFNYLTTDLAGILTRSVAGSIIPLEAMADYDDRHRYMAREYFHLMGGDGNKEAYWDTASENPFHRLWSKKTATDHLPFIVVNTTRTRDGSRGVVHPFSGTTDVFQNYHDLSRNYDGEFISFADAVFLTNRFPAVSPAARIADKGYFVDGGYYENSGLQSILEVLQYARGQADADTNSVFRQLLDFTPVVVNIRNSSTAFYANKLAEWHIAQDSVNLTTFDKEIRSIVKAATLNGTEALPNYYHNLLSDSLTASAYQIHKYITIDLPYRVDDPRDLHALLGGQIVTDNCWLNLEVDSLNARIETAFSADPSGILKPALGRSISDPTLRYMEKMRDFPAVRAAIDSL